MQAGKVFPPWARQAPSVKVFNLHGWQQAAGMVGNNCSILFLSVVQAPWKNGG